MEQLKTIAGNSEDEIWEQVIKDLANQDVYAYKVIINQGNRQVLVDVDIDPGGGFEGGFEMTTLSAPLRENDFLFGIHKQDFLDEIGKFFGMQDVLIGDEEFDKHVLVKTNNPQRVKTLFRDETIRSFFLAIDEDFTFGITRHQHQRQLELSIEKGILEPLALQQIYHQFFAICLLIDEQHANSL